MICVPTCTSFTIFGHSLATAQSRAIIGQHFFDHALLDTWHKGEGRGASYWKLANALYEHRHCDLVESLCKAISSSAEESSGQQNSKFMLQNVGEHLVSRQNWGPMITTCRQIYIVHGPSLYMDYNIMASTCAHAMSWFCSLVPKFENVGVA